MRNEPSNPDDRHDTRDRHEPVAEPYVGCAGWALARTVQDEFPAGASHLARYAGVFSAVEINSSFYRPHRRSTYERWAASVPEGFRFAAKLPRTITHERRLVACEGLLQIFLDEVNGLGDKLGALLIQLPPTLAFDPSRAGSFLQAFRNLYGGALCLEPRHPSWFTATADRLLSASRVARVAADPAVVADAARPGGDATLCYLRLHGSPRMYYSRYDEERLRAAANQLIDAARNGANAWCIFDNTAEGHAIPNALALHRILMDAARS